MPLFDTPTTVSTKQVRQFSCICLILLPTVTWYWNGKLSHIVLSAVLGAVIMGLAWYRPRMVAPVFWALILLATPIGLVAGEIAMLSLYLLVFCPMGLLFRLRKRDALGIRKISRQSYWSEKGSPKSSESYYRLY